MSLYVYKSCNAWENGFELTPILVWRFRRIIYLDRFVCLHFKGMFIIKLVLYLPLGCSFKFSHIFIRFHNERNRVCSLGRSFSMFHPLSLSLSRFLHGIVSSPLAVRSSHTQSVAIYFEHGILNGFESNIRFANRLAIYVCAVRLICAGDWMENKIICSVCVCSMRAAEHKP